MYRCICGGTMRTLDSRPTLLRNVPAVRRRRRCSSCGLRVRTYEVPASETAAPAAELRTGVLMIQRALDDLREKIGRVASEGEAT